VNTEQELLAIGLANVGNSFFHGFPGTGAIARGALNYSSGVRTPLGGLFTGKRKTVKKLSPRKVVFRGILTWFKV